MTKAITINEFKVNKEAALAFIAEALRANQSFEDGRYYFYFGIENGEVTSDGENCVTISFDIDAYIVDVMAANEGWKFTEKYFTEDTQYDDEYYKYYTDNGSYRINKLFWDENDFGTVVSKFENDAVYSEKFNEIVEEIYDVVMMKGLNDMKRYLVISEKAETKTEDVINEAMNEGLQNGYYTVLAEVETIEDARKILSQHKIHPEKSGKRYESYLVYAEEQEYDEDSEQWETTGTYEFAEVVIDDDDDDEE